MTKNYGRPAVKDGFVYLYQDAYVYNISATAVNTWNNVGPSIVEYDMVNRTTVYVYRDQRNPESSSNLAQYTATVKKINSIVFTSNVEKKKSIFANNMVAFTTTDTGNKTILPYTSYINNATCAIANVQMGPNLELVCQTASSVFLVGYGLTTYTVPSDEFIDPRFDPDLLLSDHAIFGYYSPACLGSNQTFQTHICDGSTPCSYLATEGTPIRLVSDCGNSSANYSSFTYSAFDSVSQSITCTMPSLQQTVNARFWLQTQDSTEHFANTVTLSIPVQTANCNIYRENGTTVIGPGTGGDIGGDVTTISDASDFFDQILGSGTSNMKFFIGMVFVALTFFGVMMKFGVMAGTISAIGMFILMTFLGLIPVYVLIILIILIVAVTLAWRAIFPGA
jgi:hypothetical protein